MVCPGGYCMVYGMTWYSIVGVAWFMVWPGRQGMVHG